MLLCGAFASQSVVAQCSKELTLYTNALKRYLIYGDTVVARRLVNQTLESDSTYMPALYLLSRLEKDPQKAWVAAEKAAAQDTTDHHLLMQVGELSLRAKQYERTKEVLSRLTKDSHNPDHFRLLTLLHNMSNDKVKALATIDSAEVHLGKDSYFSRLRQQIYLESGEVEKALNSALDEVKTAPYAPENHFALAEVYSAMGADSLADVSYNAAIAIDKTNPSFWFEYVRFLDSRSRHTDMLIAWRNVIELKQLNIEAKLGIVESVTSKRDFYRKNFLLIEPIILRMYELYPDNQKVTDYYITHLIAGNRVEEALVMLKKRISTTQPTAEQLNRIIEIEHYINRPDSVELYVDKALSLYPDQSNFWSLKSWLQTRRGDKQGAINTLKSALKFAENSTARSSLWGEIGNYYYDLGAIKKSYEAYDKALNYNLENAMVLNNYAYHLSVSNKSLNRALLMAKRANELKPNDATYLDTLAWIYYKLGQYEEAKKVMQQAMSFDKDKSSELALHYGDILEALGSTFMAQTYWRMALERGADAKAIEERIETQKARINREKEGVK